MIRKAALSALIALLSTAGLRAAEPAYSGGCEPVISGAYTNVLSNSTAGTASVGVTVGAAAVVYVKSTGTAGTTLSYAWSNDNSDWSTDTEVTHNNYCIQKRGRFIRFAIKGVSSGTGTVNYYLATASVAVTAAISNTSLAVSQLGTPWGVDARGSSVVATLAAGSAIFGSIGNTSLAVSQLGTPWGVDARGSSVNAILGTGTANAGTVSARLYDSTGAALFVTGNPGFTNSRSFQPTSLSSITIAAGTSWAAYPLTCSAQPCDCLFWNGGGGIMFWWLDQAQAAPGFSGISMTAGSTPIKVKIVPTTVFHARFSDANSTGLLQNGY